ncbi:unnamed protein product [Rotaria sp. Silwood2]|nr:unnamed protein product [Rotaria sp. Silwood2]
MSNENIERHLSVVLISDEEDNKNNVQLIDVQCQTSTAPFEIQDQSVTTDQANNIHSIVSKTTPQRALKKKRATCQSTTSKNNQEIQLIDLATPKKASSFTIQSVYIPITISAYNRRRVSILPTFPSVIFNDNPQLLLANVPAFELSAEQLASRQEGRYKCSFVITNPDPTTPSIMIKFYNKMFGTIHQRFKLDLSILDHNFARLQEYLMLFRTTRARILPGNKSTEDLVELSEDELPQLLEFYLQIDVDLFYMKTCSFRGAQPRFEAEGIFSMKPTDCLYTMSKCSSCKLCLMPIVDENSDRPPVEFNRFGKHRFVNKYESILNCPVDCNTKNYIYVLICVCNEFDFISESKFRLEERLNNHCQIANNAIRKFLIGQGNHRNRQQHEPYGQSSNKDNMLLYQHTMQCSVAIQMFLEKNPAYWPFVPMSNEQANQDNISYRSIRSSITTTTNNVNPTDDPEIQNYFAHLPPPPAGFKFSKRQIEKQIDIFRKNILNETFNNNVYVYNAAIIAVMPPFTTDLFRRIIHYLFVTHTEAKLNTFGHIFMNTDNIRLRNGLWCAKLKPR